jgi:hypothetical protein
MTIVTETCKSGAPGQACPGSITYDVSDRYHGSIEFCGICDTGHEWDDLRARWRAREDLRLARLETD